MRAAWIADLEGTYGRLRAREPRLWTQLRHFDIRRVYLDARYATVQDLSDLRKGQKDLNGNFSVPREAGLYRDLAWIGEDAIHSARSCDADLARLGQTTLQCAYMFQTERHDPTFVLDFLHEWRALRPTRETAWTLEGLQGGWFSPELVKAVRDDPKLTVVPYGYYDAGGQSMLPHDLDLVRCNVANAGVPLSRVAVFYDGARLPQWWDGCVFTMERLPSV